MMDGLAWNVSAVRAKRCSYLKAKTLHALGSLYWINKGR